MKSDSIFSHEDAYDLYNSVMHKKIITPVREFMNSFLSHQHEIFIVGGAVRDMFLDSITTDWDFATDANPDQIMRSFPDSFCHNAYGTVTIKWPQNASNDEKVNLFEVTPYRTDHGYSDRRRPDEVKWASTIHDDLARRDFTVNAMAYNGKDIIDPFGGQADIEAKLIRAVGDADTRFSEDALRMLRAIRFASQLGFLIEEKTRDSIARNAPLITHISWERIRDEFFRILMSPHPAEGILFLKNSNLLRYILPELDVCFDIPQKSPKRHHIYDVGTHMIMSLKNCDSNDVITRFATLIHDIGKSKTFHKDPETEMITFYNHEVVSTQQATHIAERFRLSNDEKERFIKLVEHHQFVVSEDLSDNAIRRFIRNIGKDNLEHMFALRRADRLGGAAKETSWRTELFKKRVAQLLIEPFTVRDLKVDGNDVMKELDIKPSRQVGDILNDLFVKVENKEVPNEREKLIPLIHEVHGRTHAK